MAKRKRKKRTRHYELVPRAVMIAKELDLALIAEGQRRGWGKSRVMRMILDAWLTEQKAKGLAPVLPDPVSIINNAMPMRATLLRLIESMKPQPAEWHLTVPALEALYTEDDKFRLRQKQPPVDRTAPYYVGNTLIRLTKDVE